MAQEQMEGRRVGPPDAPWIEVQTSGYPELQSLGEFAVNEQNQKSDGGNLKFLGMFSAWEMSLGPDAGRIYLLLLIATGSDDEDPNLFQAFVWKTAGGPRIFMSFKSIKLELRCHIL